METESVYSPQPVEPTDDDVAELASLVAKKKKKKKKSKSNTNGSEAASDDSIGDVVSEMTDLPTDPDTLETWKSKAKQRLLLLRDLHENGKRIKEELDVALQRVKEAEEAEALVNKGLKTATTLLSERDRQIQELTTQGAAIRAELTSATEEKKKLDKRLALTRTISANLQEAKDAAAMAERRLEEAITANAKLKAANSAASSELAVLRPLRDQVTERDAELLKARLELQRLQDELSAAYARAAAAEAQAEKAEAAEAAALFDTKSSLKTQDDIHRRQQKKLALKVCACSTVGGLLGGLALAVVRGGGRTSRDDNIDSRN